MATTKGWTRVTDSKLSDSYWVKTSDETQHVYRWKRKWVRATIRNRVAVRHSVHKTRTAAMSDEKQSVAWQLKEVFMYDIYSVTDAGEHLEGRRTGLRAAFKLGRKLWREYKGAARISVRLEGVEICGDVSEMSLSCRKWYFGDNRGLPV